jgi:hypothetical protein
MQFFMGRYPDLFQDFAQPGLIVTGVTNGERGPGKYLPSSGKPGITDYMQNSFADIIYRNSPEM